MIIHFKLEIGIIGIKNYSKQRYKTRSDPTANDKCDFSYTVTDNEPFNCWPKSANPIYSGCEFF